MSDALTTVRWHLIEGSGLPWPAAVSRELRALVDDALGYPAPGTPDSPVAPLPAPGSPDLIALCLGHARDGDRGNVGAGKVAEEDFNLPLLRRVSMILQGKGFRVVEITHYPGNGYTEAMLWLARELWNLGATSATEFHFNAHNKSVRGHETLHWSGSRRGIQLAGDIQASLTEEFPQHPDRGLKARTSSDRGALFLSLTHCPAALVEPFFGDNPTEWSEFSGPEGVERLATAIAAGIARFHLR